MKLYLVIGTWKGVVEEVRGTIEQKDVERFKGEIKTKLGKEADITTWETEFYAVFPSLSHFVSI